MRNAPLLSRLQLLTKTAFLLFQGKKKKLPITFVRKQTHLEWQRYPQCTVLRKEKKNSPQTCSFFRVGPSHKFHFFELRKKKKTIDIGIHLFICNPKLLDLQIKLFLGGKVFLFCTNAFSTCNQTFF